VVVFSEQHSCDVVFDTGRLIDGPLELSFCAWNLDEFGDRVILPYHVRLCIEGIPHHAWYPDIASKVLGDEAIIHHVEEETRRRLDQRAYRCWAFCRDPSRIPQTMFLSLTEFEASVQSAQVSFVRPREARKGHIFKILIHLDVVEDLLFYHHLRDELIADGKVPWREFRWQYGRPDGDIGMDEAQPPTRFCNTMANLRRHRPDDDEDSGYFHRTRGLIHRVSHWIDNRGQSKNRSADRHRGSGWYRGETSHTRNLCDFFPPPSRVNDTQEENIALRGLWHSKKVSGTMDAEWLEGETSHSADENCLLHKSD
jgi:hypothetical protein